MAALDTLPPLLQATSGALGSALGNAIVFPLDLATTRLQHTPPHLAKKVSLIRTLQALVRRKGASRLYDGLAADSLSTILSSFLYLFFYTAATKAAIRYHEQVKRNSSNGVGRMLKPVVLRAWEEILIGVVAGVASKGITLPLSAVSVRQRLGDESGRDMGLLETIRAMYSEGGIQGMFAALPPSIPLALLPSLTLYIHSALLRLFVPERHRAHPPGQITFALGAISNAIATIPLYPLVLLKVLSQSGKGRAEEDYDYYHDKGTRSRKRRNDSLLATGFRIFNQEGYSGLYKGLEGQLLKGLVSQGVMMLVKQRVEEMTVRAWKR